MPQIAYTVMATLKTGDLRDEYIGWLAAGHVQAVVKAGALSASIIRVEEPDAPIEVHVRYVFQTRETLDRYLEEHAPALRAEGVARFPPERGITIRRQIGTIL